MNESAFPQVVSDYDDSTHEYINVHSIGGMDLRDYFAAKAMQGMFTTAAAPCLSGLQGHEEITAKAAYAMADAMMKARGE